MSSGGLFLTAPTSAGTCQISIVPAKGFINSAARSDGSRILGLSQFLQHEFFVQSGVDLRRINALIVA